MTKKLLLLFNYQRDKWLWIRSATCSAWVVLCGTRVAAPAFQRCWVKAQNLTTAITASFNKSQSAAGNCICTLSTQYLLPSVRNTYSPSQKHSRDSLWRYWRSYLCNFSCRYHLTVPPVVCKTSQEAARQEEEMMVNGHHMQSRHGPANCLSTLQSFLLLDWIGSYPGSAVDLEIRSDECRFSQGNLNAGHHKQNAPFLNKLKSTIAFNFSKETKGAAASCF